jgi:hypothetical protein
VHVGNRAGLDPAPGGEELAPFLFVARNVRASLGEPEDGVVGVVTEVFVEVVGGVRRVEVLLELLDVGFQPGGADSGQRGGEQDQREKGGFVQGDLD